MASKIDFLKRGLSADAKSFLDEIILQTKTEAEKSFEKAIETKDIDKYIKRSRDEDWVAGPVETLCDDYWVGGIETSLLKKIRKSPPDIYQEMKGIGDLDNVLYVIYAELFSVLMVKKGHDDVKYHNNIFDGPEIIVPDDEIKTPALDDMDEKEGMDEGEGEGEIEDEIIEEEEGEVD